MPKAKPTHDSRLCEAALKLAAQRGWDHVTLEHLAKTAKLPLSGVKARFKTRDDLLPVLVDWISARVFESVDVCDTHASLRDRLFELLMTRFDIVQAHRKAILSIAAATQRDSKMALALGTAQIKAMRKTFEVADSTTRACRTEMASAALWFVYLMAFRVWKSDEALDMSRTMAALDRTLRTAERLAMILRIG